jgi:hypothetical protein
VRELNAYLEQIAWPRDCARKALIDEMRQAHREAVQAGTIPADDPPATIISLADLAERGIKGKRGAGLRAGSHGKGEIALVRTNTEGTVLIVLKPAPQAEADDLDRRAPASKRPIAASPPVRKPAKTSTSGLWSKGAYTIYDPLTGWH